MTKTLMFGDTFVPDGSIKRRTVPMDCADCPRGGTICARACHDGDVAAADQSSDTLAFNLEAVE